MERYRLAEIADRRAHSGHPYLEFQRSSALSTGLYVLQADAVDRQQPHTEDEIYYVVAGTGWISVGAEEAAVEPGTVIFVPAGVSHHFHDVTQELQLLVIFGPAEATAGDDVQRPA